MNLKKPIATVTLLVTLLLQSGSAFAQASSNEALPSAIEDCGDKSTDYSKEEIDLNKPYQDQNELNFRIAFEKARTDYHAFMACVFEKVVEKMLESAGGDTSGIFGAHAPNLPEWSKPESACVAEENLTNLLKMGSPETLLKPLLEYYNEYVAHLQRLFQDVSNKIVTSNNGEVRKFEEMVTRNKTLRLLVENEVGDAIAALDGTFIGLKEMRQAFVMHVHFQCMLKNLEFYRRAMENLRRVISAIPSVVENASTHK